VKDAKANEQHKSIIGALKAAAPEWKFEQINFVLGNRGSVVESDFYTKLKKLDVQEGKKYKLFADHVTHVCEAHNRVIVPPAGTRTASVAGARKGLKTAGERPGIHGTTRARTTVRTSEPGVTPALNACGARHWRD